MSEETNTETLAIPEGFCKALVVNKDGFVKNENGARVVIPFQDDPEEKETFFSWLAATGLHPMTWEDFTEKNPELAATLDPEALEGWSKKDRFVVDDSVQGWVPGDEVKQYRSMAEQSESDPRFPVSLEYFDDLVVRFEKVVPRNEAGALAFLVASHSAAPVLPLLGAATAVLNLVERLEPSEDEEVTPEASNDGSFNGPDQAG